MLELLAFGLDFFSEHFNVGEAAGHFKAFVAMILAKKIMSLCIVFSIEIGILKI